MILLAISSFWTPQQTGVLGGMAFHLLLALEPLILALIAFTTLKIRAAQKRFHEREAAKDEERKRAREHKHSRASDSHGTDANALPKVSPPIVAGQYNVQAETHRDERQNPPTALQREFMEGGGYPES